MHSENDFENILWRTKTVLGFSSDIEVANALGLSQPAFSTRKKRNSFPIKELIEYIENNKTVLPISLEYILTGKTDDYTKSLPLHIAEMVEQILELPISDQALLAQLTNSLYEKHIVNKTLDNKK
ncbi:hypothetical protein OURE66S_03843 [Oligella ureolytica]